MLGERQILLELEVTLTSSSLSRNPGCNWMLDEQLSGHHQHHSRARINRLQIVDCEKQI